MIRPIRTSAFLSIAPLKRPHSALPAILETCYKRIAPLRRPPYSERTKFSIWPGLISGLVLTTIFYRDAAYASAAPITLGFAASGPPLAKDPGNPIDLMTQIRGRAVIYPSTGRVNFIFRLSVDLYHGRQNLGSCEKQVTIVFKLLDTNGNILEAFSAPYTQAGDRDVVFSADKEILNKTVKVLACLSYS